MTEDIRNKREELKALSRLARLAINTGLFSSVNEFLVDFYAQQGHTTLHSFKQWLKEGFCVCRGEKALLLWGEPRKAQNKEKQKTEDEDEFDFFPLAYVFSEKQVQKLK